MHRQIAVVKKRLSFDLADDHRYCEICNECVRVDIHLRGGIDGNDLTVDITDLGLIATNWQSSQPFNEAWEQVRGTGFGAEDDGITAEQWEWLLSLTAANANWPRL
jgi:hypothetical protein